MNMEQEVLIKIVQNRNAFMKCFMFFMISFFILSCGSLNTALYDFEQNESLIVLYDDYKNDRTKERWEVNIVNPEKHNYRYYYFYNLVDNISLSFREYGDFDKQYYDQPMLFFKVNKSFLRKNKDIILTKEKMLKLGYEKTFKLFYNAKHILLIDKNEIEKGRVVIKEVFFANAIEE